MAADTIGTGIGIAILAGGVIGYFLWRRHSNLQLKSLRADGAVAEATITEIFRHAGGDGPGEIGVSYSFTPSNASRSISKIELLGVLPPAVPKVGDRVSVRYDPKHPEIARLDLGTESSAF